MDYIVTQTVGRQIEGRSPAQLADGRDNPPFRVLDMACGSGSFLLGAYRCLLDYCLKWYAEHKPQTFKKAVYQDPRNSHWRLTIGEKKRILTAHVFGVDIDAQAVEVTKLSLLLKVLEGETDQSLSRQQRLFHDRALPNLADNIKCGNSLIGPSYFTSKLNLDPEEMKRINPFDWKRGFPNPVKAGGFDCIIGNPPYVPQETLAGLKEYLAAHYEAFDGVADLYAYFMEQSIRLLRVGGRSSFIVSSSFLRATYGVALRRVLKKYAAVLRIVDFGGLAVFENAKNTYVCIPLLEKVEQPPRVEISRISSPQVRDLDAFVGANCFTIPHERLSAQAWALMSDKEAVVFAKLMKTGKPLGDYVARRIFYGIKTGLNEAFVVDTETKRKLISQDRRSAELMKPLLGGETSGGTSSAKPTSGSFSRVAAWTLIAIQRFASTCAVEGRPYAQEEQERTNADASRDATSGTRFKTMWPIGKSSTDRN